MIDSFLAFFKLTSKTIILFLLIVLAESAYSQSDTMQASNMAQANFFDKRYPSLDFQYILGIELNLKKEINRKVYSTIGIGAVGSVINRHTELFKVKYVVGYYLLPKIHAYTGLKTGWYYNQEIEHYYHFVGSESGLFVDLTKVELGIKYTVGFDKTDFSKVISGANYFVLRIPLYKRMN